jgi:hypothetical protein
MDAIIHALIAILHWQLHVPVEISIYACTLTLSSWSSALCDTLVLGCHRVRATWVSFNIRTGAYEDSTGVGTVPGQRRAGLAAWLVGPPLGSNM